MTDTMGMRARRQGRMLNARRLMRYLFPLLFCAMSLNGCDLLGSFKTPPGITVGSRHITVEELRKNLEFFSSDLDLSKQQLRRVKDQLLDQVINHYLILEYGREKDISVSEREMQAALQDIKTAYNDYAFKDALLRGYVDAGEWKKQLRDQLLVRKILAWVSANMPPPSYEEMQRYFQDHISEFTFSRMVKFRQIVTDDKEIAENLAQRIKNGEDMGELARKHSIAPEAAHGGEVGWLAEGQLDEIMEKHLFSLSKGDLSDAVQTPYGYHLFQVLDVRPEGVKTLPEVIGDIEETLTRQHRERYLETWIENLRTQYEVRMNDNLEDIWIFLEKSP